MCTWWMSINQSALLEDKSSYKKRWMIDGKSDDIQTSYSHAVWFWILIQIPHIYPGKGYLFLLPVHRIQRASTPPHRPPYASPKAPCPNTATPPSSAAHPPPCRPPSSSTGPTVADQAIDTAGSGSGPVLPFIQISPVQRTCNADILSPSATSVQWWKG
jgi:hypothetical protein